jgi:hypothetical protein
MEPLGEERSSIQASSKIFPKLCQAHFPCPSKAVFFSASSVRNIKLENNIMLGPLLLLALVLDRPSCLKPIILLPPWEQVFQKKKYKTY